MSADELDRQAGLAYQAGHLAVAAGLIHLAREEHPERAALWDARERQVRQAAAGRDLATDANTRLAASGIAPGDPGVRQWAAWNASVIDREAGQ